MNEGQSKQDFQISGHAGAPVVGKSGAGLLYTVVVEESTFDRR